MRKLWQSRLWQDENGSTVTEYALLASLIAVALGSTFLALGAEMSTKYEHVETNYVAANKH